MAIEEGGVLFRDEYIVEVCEYAPGSLICSGRKTQELFLCENLTSPPSTIQAPSIPNDNKYSIQLMYGFDLESFPFFLVSGSSEIWIGNIRTKKM